MPIIAIALLIAAALGGGTAALAQQSLPGDLLWGFKVHINENVAGALSTSDISKANWDIAAIRTRLAEAQTLDARGKLDTRAQADITSNFKEHSQDIADVIGKLEDAGQTAAAADVATRFQSAIARYISIQSDTGGQAVAQTAAQADTASTLMTSVRTTLDEATQLSVQTSASLDSSDTADESLDAGINDR